MPMNRDDIIGEISVSGSSGITCNRVEISIDPITRNLHVNFNIVNIVVLGDGRYYEDQQMPLSVDLSDGTGTKTFDIYSRRTGQKLAGGLTRTYDLLSRDIISLFFDAAAKAGIF